MYKPPGFFEEHKLYQNLVFNKVKPACFHLQWISPELSFYFQLAKSINS